MVTLPLMATVSLQSITLQLRLLHSTPNNIPTHSLSRDQRTINTVRVIIKRHHNIRYRPEYSPHSQGMQTYSTLLASFISTRVTIPHLTLTCRISINIKISSINISSSNSSHSHIHINCRIPMHIYSTGSNNSKLIHHLCSLMS